MSDLSKELAVLRDYIERSTHWAEGGAGRHDALKVALPAVEDGIEWIEKGINEWRLMYVEKARQLAASEASLRIAIAHLNAVLNKARTFDEQQRADTAARDWLTSIGSEPS